MDNNYWLHMSANSLIDASWDPLTAQEACEEELVKIAGMRSRAGAAVGEFLGGLARKTGFVSEVPVVGKEMAMGMRAGLKHGPKSGEVLARAERIAKGRVANEQVKQLADKRGYSLVPKGTERSAEPLKATMGASEGAETLGAGAGGGTVADWWAKRTAGEKLGLGVAGGAAAGAGAMALGSGGSAPKNVNHY